MVFDQDSIVCVSENLGDIIYTYEFEKFRQECSMNIYMCRGADPESKGKIENTFNFQDEYEKAVQLLRQARQRKAG